MGSILGETFHHLRNIISALESRSLLKEHLNDYAVAAYSVVCLSILTMIEANNSDQEIAESIIHSLPHIKENGFRDGLVCLSQLEKHEEIAKVKEFLLDKAKSKATPAQKLAAILNWRRNSLLPAFQVTYDAFNCEIIEIPEGEEVYDILLFHLTRGHYVAIGCEPFGNGGYRKGPLIYAPCFTNEGDIVRISCVVIHDAD